MRVSHLIAVSGVLITAHAALAQPVAFDTFGPGNSYNPNQSHPIRGAGATGGFMSNGYLFAAEESGTVAQIVTAFEHLSGLNNFAIEIRAGDANQVSPQQIGVWKDIEGGSAADPVITISHPSISGPAELVAGQTYWILFIGEADATGRWFQRETPGTSTYWAQSTDAFNWWLVNSTQHRALRIVLEGDPCYANCDGSTTEPILTVDDFTCFINQFAIAQGLPHEQQITHYANCDGSTTPPVLTVDDFTCFINEFAQGCP